MSNPRILSRIPGEGAAVIPALGAGVPIDPLTSQRTGIQAALPLIFTPSWQGTQEELLTRIQQQIDGVAPPGAQDLIDDSSRLASAINGALAIGCELEINSPVYVGTKMDITCGDPYNGSVVRLIVKGTGVIIAGPDLDGALLTLRNSGTVGETGGSTVDLYVEGLSASTEMVPGDPFSAKDVLYVTGFRKKTIFRCKLKVANHYLDNKGDSCLFITGDDVTISHCEFMGSRDLGVYMSGSSTGTSLRSNYTLIANKYYYCRNAWKGSRNSRNIISVGEHFIGCVNGPACPSPSSGWDGMVGFNVTVSGPIFENMVSRCIDCRNSYNWNVTGLMAYGTLGIQTDGTIDPAATVVSLTGSANCRVEGVVNVTGSDANNSIVRLATINSVESTGNTVDILAYNSVIGNGILELTGDDNDFRIKAGTGVDTLFTLNGANSRVEWMRGDMRGVNLGGIDVTPGRVQFGAVRTASTVFASVPLNRLVRVQPAAQTIDMTLPEAQPGDYVGFIKWTGSSGKFVNIKNPAGATIFRLRDIGDFAWLICENDGSWVVENRSLSAFDRWVSDSTVITASGPISGTLSGRIIDVQPPGTATVDAALWSGGRNGDFVVVRKAAGSGTGSVAVKSPGGATVATLHDIGDAACFVADESDEWSVLFRQDAFNEQYEVSGGVITVGRNYAPGTDATSLLQAVAVAARDAGLPWQLRAGVTYTVLGKVTTWTDFSGKGAKIVTTNEGQTDPVFEVAPVDDDVEAVSLSEANSWTLVKGSAIIPELSGQRGWTYTIDGADTDIARATGNNIRQGQTFTVVTDDGQISTPLRVAFTQPFNVSTVITRQRARRPLIVNDLDIGITSSSGVTGRDVLVRTTRSNTVFNNCALFNDASLEVRQGFVHNYCEDIIYDNCSVDGLLVNNTNYGWNGNIATGVTFRDCKASGCRRDIDGHKCADYRVIGGNFPDGIGGHWLHGLNLSAWPTIGASNPANNPYCIQMAGSDLVGEANFQIDNGSIQAVKIRGDIFELSGRVELNAKWTIDNSNNQLGSVSPDLYLVRLGGQNASYDTGRTIAMPSSVKISGTVELIGDCNFMVHALAISVSANSTSFPQPVEMSGRAQVDLTLVNFPDTIGAGCSEPAYVGIPPVRVDYLRPQTSTGSGYDISIKGIPDLRLYADAGTVDNISEARASFTIDGLRTSFLTCRYGGFKTLQLTNSAAPGTVEISDGTNEPVGDERFYFDSFGRPASSNFAAGRYFWPQGHGPNTATFTVAANTLYLFAFDKTLDADALAIEITTGAAGACRSGIYFSDAKGAPYLLMEEADEIADTTAMGIQPMPLSGDIRLQGKCYLAMVFSGTPTIRATAIQAVVLNDNYGRGGFNTSTPTAYLTASRTYGALPVVCPSVSGVETTSPCPALTARSA